MIQILVIIPFLIYHVIHDREKIQVGLKIYHWRSSMWRSLLFGMNAWSTVVNQLPNPDMVYFMWFFLFQAVIYWIVFDISLNIARGLKWNYVPKIVIGQTSLLDILFNNLYLQYIVKFSLLYLTIINI